MKILVTAQSYYPEATGVSNVVTAHARGFVNNGNSVTVATAVVQGRPREEEVDGVRVLRYNIVGNCVRGMRGEVEAYQDFVVKEAPDILVCHCAQTWNTDALLPVIGRIGCSFVLVSHGLSAYHEDEYKQYYVSLADSIRKARGRVIALTEVLEEVTFCREQELAPPIIIPNGVDIEQWTAAPLDVRGKWGIGTNPWVVTVSNHSTVKNHNAFWSVVERSSEDIAGIQGSIIGRGYGAEKFRLGRLGVRGGCWYRCRLKSLFSDCVRLHSNTTRPEVVSAIKEADLLLVTSTREAAPLAVLEAMAAGTPWISFKVGNYMENVGGIAVDSQSEMVAALKRVLLDKELAERLGREGYERVQARHSWGEIVNAHQRAYSTLVACK